MSILSAQSIRRLGRLLIRPFIEDKQVHQSGLSYGLSCCGYDVRLDQDLWLWPFGFSLGSTLEWFAIPDDLLMRIHDKSTWARRRVFVQNTVAEPGWQGYLTLKVTNHSIWPRRIKAGTPIAQVIFERLDMPTDRPYRGKYQNQKRGPQPALKEGRPCL